MFVRVLPTSAVAFALLTAIGSAATINLPITLPAGAGTATTDFGRPDGRCLIPSSTVDAIQAQLKAVVQLDNGGLFRPSRMWSAVVDRDGRTCSVTVIGDAWPGSRAIALAKAFTANGFSNSALSLSTTMLYPQVQPGGSLFGLENSNPFNPAAYENNARGHINGGVIVFGGGLALYEFGKVIGALGVSGDTSCADHVIAYRMRRNAGFGSVPNYGNGFITSDNIAYPDDKKPAQPFRQPHCLGSDIPPAKI